MFNADRYLEHAEESPEFDPMDFTDDPSLVEKVNFKGSINNVKYSVSTGIVEDDEDGLSVELG